MKKNGYPRWGLIIVLLTAVVCILFSHSIKNGEESGEAEPSNYRSKEEISIAYWNIESLVKESAPDGILQFIQNRFNIKITPVSVTWSNYKERYRTLSLADSLPDVFSTVTLSSGDPSDSATYSSMIENGRIRALPDDLSEWPGVKTVVNSVPAAQWTDGHYYLIPRRSFSNPVIGMSDAAMLVRKDWMENLGLQNPESFDDFKNMAVAFSRDDPDGNGIDDTIGYNINSINALGKWVILGIRPELNTFSWIEYDGQYTPTWACPEFTEMAVDFQELYREGALDPEFYTKNPGSVLEDFASGRLGLLEYKYSPAALRQLEDLWKKYNTTSFYDCVGVLPIFPTEGGIRYSNASNNIWSESYISSSVSDEKLERILDLYEYLLSDEGQQLINYGIEGTDYEVQADGSIQILVPISESHGLRSVLLEKYPSLQLFSSLAQWEDQNWNSDKQECFYELKYGKNNLSMAKDALLWCQKNTTQIKRPLSFLNAPKEETSSFSSSSAQQNFISCILGEEPAGKSWESYISTLKKAGLDAYIEKQNRIYQQLVSDS